MSWMGSSNCRSDASGLINGSPTRRPCSRIGRRTVVNPADSAAGIVEPAHRNLVGHPQASTPGGLQYTQGEHMAQADDCGWPVRHGQQPAAGTPPGRDRVVSARYEPHANAQHLKHPAQSGRVVHERGLLLGKLGDCAARWPVGVHDHRNMPMAKRFQMLTLIAGWLSANPRVANASMWHAVPRSHPARPREVTVASKRCWCCSTIALSPVRNPIA